MTSVLLGRSLVGMRALDVAVAQRVLAHEVGGRAVYGAGHGSGAVALLHAAAAGTPFAGLLLDEMLASYLSVVETPLHSGMFESIVRGALRWYDLPDLTSMAGGRVWVVDAISPMGWPVLPEHVKKQYARSPSAVVIRRNVGEAEPAVYERWLE
jgi:hypothetical protein